MTPKLLHVVATIVLILGAGLNGPSGCYGGLRQKVERLEAKQEDLEERVNVLEEDLASLIQDTRPTNPTSPLTTPAPITTGEFVVTPLDVRRETIATGYRFTVRYVPHQQNLRVVYVSDTVVATYGYENVPIYQELNGIADDETSGVMKVTFEKSISQPSHPFASTNIYFMTETERVGIQVNLHNSSSNVLSSSIHLSSFSVTPSERLVYQHLHDTDTITINYSGWSYLNLVGVIANLDSSEVMEIDGVMHSDYFHISDSNLYTSDVNFTVAGSLETATYRISGYVDSTVGTYSEQDNSSAINSFSVTKRLEVYPSDQSGPFPEDLVAFAKTSTTTELEDGRRLYYCNVTEGNPCPIIVNLLSTEHINLSCSELNQVGMVPLPVTTPNVQGFGDYLKSYIFTIQNQTARPEPSQVECTATSESGVGVAQHIEVAYFTQPQILLDSSSVVVQTGSIEVTCVAAGYPLPSKLIVHVEKSTYYHAWHDIPENQTTVSSDGTEITGTFTLETSPNVTIVKLGCWCELMDVREDHYAQITSGYGVLLS